MRSLFLPLLIAIAGCTSVSSTLLNRDEMDCFHGNSNGKPSLLTGETKSLKGVPITLRLPTHLDVVVKESVFIRNVEGKAPIRLHSPHRHLFVETTLIETEKVFTVDPKRPAAGTLTYNMTFGDDKNSQYFKSIASNIQDDTIKEVTNSLNTILPMLKGQATGAEDHTSPTIAFENRTIAWKRFDLDAVDLETQVRDFVAVNLTCSEMSIVSVEPLRRGVVPPTPTPGDPGSE